MQWVVIWKDKFGTVHQRKFATKEAATDFAHQLQRAGVYPVDILPL